MSGGSRVSIPNNVRKTIKDIKEIAGNHSDEDIYEMLKECNMDPNESTQRLLYLDTFHEVKTKRDRRKVNVNNRIFEESRLTAGIHGQDARGGRRDYSSPLISYDAVGGRNASAQKENGAHNQSARGFRSSLPVPQKTENFPTSRFSNFAKFSINGPRGVSNGSSTHECPPQLSAAYSSNFLKDSSVVDANKVRTVPPSTPTLSPVSALDPVLAPGIGNEEGKSTSNSTHVTCTTSVSVSGVHSSASDPILGPSLNSSISATVGTIKCQVDSQKIAAESSANILAGKNFNDCFVNNIQPTSGVVDSANEVKPGTPQRVEQTNVPELSQPSFLATPDGSLVVISVQDSRSPNQLLEHSKVVASKAAATAVETSSPSILELNVSALEEATSKLDLKIKKVTIRAQPVIFADHLHVPEAYKNGLIFGSLDASSGQNIEHINSPDGGKASVLVAEPIQGNDEVAREPSSSNQGVSPGAKERDYSDQPSPSHVPENLSLVEENVSIAAVSKYDQPKQNIMSALGGPQHPSVQTAPNYAVAFGPPGPGSQLVQFEGLEPQGGNPVALSPSSISVTEPAGVGQSPTAVLPQPVHVFRQPYPPYYFPYGPYFSGYIPHYLHQFLGHGGFPQQPSTGNAYFPPTAAASGMKLSVPLGKPETNAGTLTQLGLPSTYGSHNSPAIGYNLNSAVISLSSAGKEDPAASELKENKIYTNIQQTEGSLIWFPPSGQDISSLPANSFYNFHQGQHIAFPPAQAGHGGFAGLYRPTVTGAASSTPHPQLLHSQAMAGSVAYQQH